ncbi:AEC family transporter [Leptothrix discophora]|uniref:AEC family transporter n=1 Tax=Leptothrix discophora TaxID=89 RepID=A0ABT9G3W4_LEPDI|nr:AEC family transporter [Leptothrix discophora]MDP4301179.1 AEC family transporter [Leptothrix discophora]
MTWDLAFKLLALFAMIAIGWIATRRGMLGGAEGQRALAGVGFGIFLPALLFRTMAVLDLSSLPVQLLLAFFGPLVLWALAVWCWERRRAAAHDDPQGHPADPAVRTVALTFGNSVQVGLPFAAALFGEAGLQLHLAIVALHALVILSLITLLAEIDLARAAARRGAGAPLGPLLLGIARQSLLHPVVLPVLLGMAWQLAGLRLHPVADNMLQTLGQAGVPLCLILIGASLAQHGLSADPRALIGRSLLKLLVLPALVASLGWFVFGLRGLPLSVLVMAAALPIGSNALLFAQRYRTREGEASAVIVVSTLLFAFSAPLWLLVLAWLS